MQTRHDVLGFIQTQSRLGDIGNPLRIFHFQAVDIGFGRHQDGGFGRFTQRADHLVMILMPDQDDGVALLGELDRFQMDLGHQRAGGVDDVQLPLQRPVSERQGKPRGR